MATHSVVTNYLDSHRRIMRETREYADYTVAREAYAQLITDQLAGEVDLLGVVFRSMEQTLSATVFPEN